MLSSTGDRLIVVAVGHFGNAVAECLRAWAHSIVLVSRPSFDEIDILFKQGYAVAISITSGSAILDCDLIDKLSHVHGTPYLPLNFDNLSIVLGPVVLPGRSSCWRCWMLRQTGVDGLSNLNRFKQEHYRTHQTPAPQGYLPSLAHLAAGQLKMAILGIHAGVAIPGQVIHTDLFGRHIVTTSSLGFDNCDRCGLKRSLKSRSFMEMKRSLESLW